MISQRRLLHSLLLHTHTCEVGVRLAQDQKCVWVVEGLVELTVFPGEFYTAYCPHLWVDVRLALENAQVCVGRRRPCKMIYFLRIVLHSLLLPTHTCEVCVRLALE